MIGYWHREKYRLAWSVTLALAFNLGRVGGIDADTFRSWGCFGVALIAALVLEPWACRAHDAAKPPKPGGHGS